MRRRTKIAIGAAAVVGATALLGGGLAVASSGDDGADSGETETPITGSALQQASAAALAHTGGGTVTDSEVGDQEGYYEVEVTLANGSQVDVHLDEGFAVIGSDADSGTDK